MIAPVGKLKSITLLRVRLYARMRRPEHCVLLFLLVASVSAGAAAGETFVSSGSALAGGAGCEAREVPGLGLPTSVLLVTGGDIWSYDVATGAHEHVVSLWRAGGGPYGHFCPCTEVILPSC